MNPIKYVVIAVGALAFASLVAVTGPYGGVSAQAPEPTPEAITVAKVCEDGAEAFGPFEITVNYTIELGISDPHPQFGPLNERYDEAASLDCDGELILDGSTAEECFSDEPQSGTNDDLFCFLNNHAGPGTSVSQTVTEASIEGIAAEFTGDCNREELIDSEADFERYVDQGFLCIVTNASLGSDLVINKACLGSASAGDADFNIVVSTELGAAVAFEALDCGEVMLVEDLEEGMYRVQEFITGPDANNFLTAIVCATADGQMTTGAALAEVDLEAGVDAECEIVNAFDENGDGVIDSDEGAPATIIPIDIDNTNTNTLDNLNDNGNNNQNTNTQDQSNFQKQINDNNQVTTVNSSPSVVITGLPRASQPAAPIPGPGPSIITGPNTGEAGLVN